MHDASGNSSKGNDVALARGRELHKLFGTLVPTVTSNVHFPAIGKEEEGVEDTALPCRNALEEFAGFEGDNLGDRRAAIFVGVRPGLEKCLVASFEIVKVPSSVGPEHLL